MTNYITVKGLKEILDEFPNDAKIILQKDAEGNYYSPLYAVWTGTYAPETTWYGNAHLSKLTESDQRAGFDEGDVRKPGGENVAALFLVPVN